MKIEKIKKGTHKLSKGDIFIDSETFLGVDFYLMISLNDNLTFGLHDESDLFLSDLNTIYLVDFNCLYKWRKED